MRIAHSSLTNICRGFVEGLREVGRLATKSVRKLVEQDGAAQRQANDALPINVRPTATITGHTIGLGVAQAFGDNLIGPIKLDRTDYGKKSYVGVGVARVRCEPKATNLTVGFAYSF
jgi:opacity protein-like surface antigen